MRIFSSLVSFSRFLLSLRRQYRGLLLVCLMPSLALGQSPVLKKIKAGAGSVVVTPVVPAGYTETLIARAGCKTSATALMDAARNLPAGATSSTSIELDLTNDVVAKDSVCVEEDFTPVPAAGGPAKAAVFSNLETVAAQSSSCGEKYNDCSWGYTVVGGVEQSDLSSQNSQTDGFVDLFARGPLDPQDGSIWLQARFLGAPSDSNTQNIAATATDPSGTVTSATLSSVGYAVDYMVGYEYDFRKGHRFTVGPIIGAGGTTPLSSQSATVAYAVPAYGTNECNELQQKFGAGSKFGYNPSLPGSGTITTTVTTGSSTASPTVSPEYCSVMPVQTSTVSTSGGTTTTTTVSGTQITNIAFSPQDRSSFLLKYVAGFRLISRRSIDDNACAESSTLPLTDQCERTMADFTVGQDESITGGYLRHFVFKSTVMFPIPNTGVSVFLSASNRLARNVNSPPLILTPTPIFTGSGTPPGGAVVVPSSSVFVLPLKQSDRDFYRIGVALDLSTVLPKLFQKKSN